MENVSALAPQNPLLGRLAKCETPKESKEVEVLASAARAWAKEKDDYEGFVQAEYVYVLARRKTTELIAPYVKRGGDGSNQYESKGNTDVTLADLNFTKMQWNRRVKELEIPLTEVDSYFDDCLSKRWHPSLAGLLSFKANYHTSDKSYEWYTPAEIIQTARRVMRGIDLDPASTEEANRVIGAQTIYTEESGGLSQNWFGCIWLNPPYNMPEVEDFTTKAHESYQAGKIKEALILVNNSTDAEWFHRLLENYPVCFTRGRVKYWGPDASQARQGQAIFYLGKNAGKFKREFSHFGTVMRRWTDDDQ